MDGVEGSQADGGKKLLRFDTHLEADKDVHGHGEASVDAEADAAEDPPHLVLPPEEDEDEEAEDDLQLAWEILDTARVIYAKHACGDKASSLQIAEVYIALGDTSMEAGMRQRKCVNA